MPWLTLILSGLPIVFCLWFLVGVRRLRRHGFGDRTAELLAVMWLAVSLAVAVIRVGWPAAPTWAWVAPIIVGYIIGFSVLAVRIRRNPQHWRNLMRPTR